MLLFVIGNGFDIYSGMKTSYKEFYNFLKTKYPDFFDSIAKTFLAENETDRLWSNFEESLADFNADTFLSKNVSPNEISNKKLDLKDKLALYFRMWIESYPTLSTDRSIKLPYDGFYINFNYTTTLETTYGIPDDSIVHIHGSIYDKNTPFIFGHNSKETIDDLCESYGIIENGEMQCTVDEFNLLLSTEMLLYTLKKPVDNVINKMLLQLTIYNKVDEVIVLGHSLGYVDWDYFHYISKSIPKNVPWTISAYSERDKEQIRLFTTELGISNYKIDSIQNIIDRFN